MAGLAAKKADHARVESELKAIADGIQHSEEKLEENRKELENLRAEKGNKDDRNSEGGVVDLHMEMASITENLRKKAPRKGCRTSRSTALWGHPWPR